MHSIALQVIGEHLARTLPSGAVLRVDGSYRRVDAAVATAFVAQELEHVQSQTFDIQKVALRCRDFLPVNREAHPGAEIIAWDQYDSFGEADVVEDYAKDFPRVDAEKTRNRDIIFSLGDSYGYTVQELLAIAMAGSRLNDERALQARRGMEAKLEKIVARGLPRKGKHGFTNHPNVALFGAAFAWNAATPAAQIKRELGALVQSIVVNSSQIERPDTLLLPTAAYALASEVTFGVDNPRSVLQVFLDQSPYIRRVDQWVQLDGAGVGGADRIVCYRYGKDVAEIGVPLEYDEMPPEVRGLEFVVHAHMRTAGTIIRRPMAMTYADGTFDASDITTP